MATAETKTSVDKIAINTIRTLSMDAVEKAKSGHPGTPMALAPVTYQLWQHNLRYDPSQPMWPGRDRFVLSCGHASMLLYSMLHLAGVRKVAKHENRLEDGLAITLDDDNTITIEGHTELAFSEDVATRFEGYGWNALQVDDANDLGAIQRAIDSAKKVTDKPSIIVLKSIIGYGAPNKANTHGAHGAPLGPDAG